MTEYLKPQSLTPKQQKVLDYIIENKGKEFSPKELAEELGYSESNHISPILKKFLWLGFLRKKGTNRDTKYINENA